MNTETSRPFQAEFDAAVRIAREAGLLLLEMQGQTRDIGFKGQADLVTDADRASEALITDRLSIAFPDDGILGEESGYSDLAATAERLWVVDPLDGTTNYAHGFPIYSVSIALVVDGTVEVGAVYMPPLDEMFAAERGQGAWLNDGPASPSDCDDVRNAVLCSGFPYDVEERPRSFEDWRKFTLAARAVRRIGSAAYDLCCVACGRFDGYWERWTFRLGSGCRQLDRDRGRWRNSQTAAWILSIFGREILATAFINKCRRCSME
ncbi:MAG: inositol monophosphatase family protein [Thermomicrobiales bacterium]